MPDNLPEPVPAATCEWYGSISRIYQQEDGSKGKTSNQLLDQTRHVTTATGEGDCPTRYFSASEMQFRDIQDQCRFSSQQFKGTGTGTSRFESVGIAVTTFGAFPSVSTPAAPYLVPGSRTTAGCGDADRTETYNVERDAGLSYSGGCPSDGRTLGPNAQAFVIRCIDSFRSDSELSYANSDTQVTGSFRRRVCDFSIDSDGGGVGDCQEYANKTDPAVASDDAPGDRDGDGILDVSDNCPDVKNFEQADLDGDRIGDSCDPDIDGDTLSNEDEATRGTDPRDPDTDSDGVSDAEDQCGTVAGTGENGCPIPDPDPPPKPATVRLSGGFVYAGGLARSGASVTGADGVGLLGPADVIAGAQVCVKETWAASIQQVFPSSIPFLWNGQVIPFEDSRLSGERSKNRKNLFSTRLTETVTYDDCRTATSATFGPFPDANTLVVTGPNQLVSLSHTLNVRATLRSGQVLSLKVGTKTDRGGRIAWSKTDFKTFNVIPPR